MGATGDAGGVFLREVTVGVTTGTCGHLLIILACIIGSLAMTIPSSSSIFLVALVAFGSFFSSFFSGSFSLCLVGATTSIQSHDKNQASSQKTLVCSTTFTVAVSFFGMVQ